MNKTFKIVFNKARGALMVANEITGSVQRSGKNKVALCIAVAGLLSSSVTFATPTHSPSVVWDSANTPQGNSFIFDRPELPVDTIPVGMQIKSDAQGTIYNTELSLKANNDTHPYPAAVRALFQFGTNSNATFAGDFTHIYLETNHTGTGNSEASAFTNYGGTTNFNATNTILTTKTPYINGKYAIALEAYGDKSHNAIINFNADSVTLNVESSVDRIDTGATDANRRAAVVGALAIYGEINSNAKVFNVTVKSLGETLAPADQELSTDGKNYTTTAPEGKVGAADATGLEADGGQINVRNTTNIDVSAIGGTATGLAASDSYYTSTTGIVDLDRAGIILENANIDVKSEKASATGLLGTQTVSDGVLINIKGNLNLNVSSNQGNAYGVNLDGGRSIIGSSGKDVTINVSSPSVSSRNVWVHNNGILSFGQKDGRVNSVSLNNVGTGDSDPYFIGRVDTGSTLNIFANSYTQTGSGHGLYVVGDKATLNIDVDSFISSSAYTAIHTREAASAVANVNAKLFQATATGDDAGVALLQFNEGSTINVTADDVSLTGTKKLGGGVLGTGTWGAVNLTANNSMVLNGNINGVYGAVDNNGKEAAFNIKAKTLSLNGDINVGSLNESKESTKTNGAVSNFSRNTHVSVTAENAAITGNINVWGNAGQYNNANDSNIVNLKLGDGSVISGDVSIIGKGQETNQVEITATGQKKDLSFNGNISAANNGQLILNGGTYKVDSLTLDNAKLSLTAGTLQTSFEQLTGKAFGTDSAQVKSAISAAEGSVFAITDEGTYTKTWLDSLQSGTLATISMLNANLQATENDSNLSITRDLATAALTGFDTISIGDGATLTLQGKDKTSSLSSIELTTGTSLKVINESKLIVDKLSGIGNITVGENDGNGASMSIQTLSMTGGSIFVDPTYGESSVTIGSLDNKTLRTHVTAGNGALVVFGTDVSSAQNAVSKLDGFDSVESLVYVGIPMALSDTGSIVIDPNSHHAVTTDVAKSVIVKSNGALVIDQATIGDNAVFEGASTILFDGGKLGITNATVGTITLTDAAGTVVNGITTATTDNPFVEAAVNGNTVVNTMSAEGGLGALASTGIQAMTRRADTVLAQTIADRTSVDQELAAGTNLWVDVTGERYEADKLDNGGEFKSDMGYGAFGADFAVTQDITAGAAFQYGKGSLRSGVSSIKNSIDSYGVTAYGAMKFGDSKVVAEASYIKNENDVTSSQTALNQSVDSGIYSVGVRGQHRFTAGNFQFVPSVGVRVSRLNTDAMQVGAVNIKKQEQTLVQVPIALRVNGFEQNVSGWSVAPSFKVAYVPTFGDKEISVFGADQTVIDTSPVQGDFGIRAQNGNLMVNANMMLGGGKDGTSSVGGKVGLKYVF